MLRRDFTRFLILFAALAILGTSAPPALAQSLDQLRASGAVGERYDGFAQAIDPSAKSAVGQINAQRQKVYAERAQKTGAPVDQVGRVYAQQIFNSAPKGTKFLQENGAWITK